jgi:hypothetical protein
MAITTEQIRGNLVFTTNQRRTQAENFIGNWARREGFTAPAFEEVNDKYGPGPNLVVAMDFPTKADADAAWAQIDGFNPSFIVNGSMIQQITDLNDGTPATIRHRFRWVNGGRITEV